MILSKSRAVAFLPALSLAGFSTGAERAGDEDLVKGQHAQIGDPAPAAYENMQKLKVWVDRNKEAIYDVRPLPVGEVVYLPAGKALPYRVEKDGTLSIEVPTEDRSKLVDVIRITFVE